MERKLRRKILNETGRYVLSSISFLAIGGAVTAIAPPLLATGVALVGTLWVFDKLKVRDPETK